MRLILPALAVALLACHSPPPSDAIELRTYDVPKGTAGSLVTTIEHVMWINEARNMGRAVVTPDGRLAVLATPGVHAGVQTLVDAVAKHPPMGDATVTIQYFLVLGKPAAAPQPYPAGAQEIREALDEIVKSQGPQTFTLPERVALASTRDDEGRLDNVDEKLEIRQTAVYTSDGTYARVSIRWQGDKLETRVHLAPDHTVVLGATGRRGGDAEGGATLYYVVRLADGKAR